MMRLLRRLLIGRPLHNFELAREKLPKWKALPIFSSDALSSVGYGPEQVMLALAAPGIVAYGFMLHVSVAILLLLAIVTTSYIQVTRANPGGGGSYAVAKANLGEFPALLAAASLFADYTLTVAVSVSSGTAAIISAFPALVPHEVTIDLAVLFGVLMVANLRGVREASSLFVWPTYAFIFGMLALVAVGAYQAITGAAPLISPQSMQRQFDWLVLFAILRAFANGCSSMTGIEAISNGVKMFRRPAVSNAGRTTMYMSLILAVMFAGIAFLMMHYHVMPQPKVTALSVVAENTFGRSIVYYFIQITTMLVLYLAANTSFNGLPPLLSLLARDGYAPRYLGVRGERLSFSNGIILLSIFAGILIYTFQGNVEHLISLYAIGVFMSFTIAQWGMVVHWRRKRTGRWRVSCAINGTGAVVTAAVVLIIGVAKFSEGAWMVIVFIPATIFVFKKIRSHYNDVAEQLHLPEDELDENGRLRPRQINNKVLVPIATPTSVVVESIAYAKSLSSDVTAVNIVTDEEIGRRVRKRWEKLDPEVELVTIYSSTRLVIQPLLDYIEELEREHNGPDDYITVVIPEFEPQRWWHRLLHNQTGWVLRTRLILKTNVIVVTIPFHLKK
ncbi:MAG: APC family permease [Negativicutes bacterium]|nr:APC family permease [Negativicutes bacterium]